MSKRQMIPSGNSKARFERIAAKPKSGYVGHKKALLDRIQSNINARSHPLPTQEG